METLRLAILFLHLLFCAFSLAKVLTTDALFVFGHIAEPLLRREAGHIKWLLIGLWVSGLSILYLDTRFEWVAVIDSPKLVLKLMIVVLLTINGFLLHVVAFPLLRTGALLTRLQVALLIAMGVLSTSHWLLAAFIGIARPLRNVPLTTLVPVYLGLVFVLFVTALLVSPRVNDRITQWQITEELRALKESERRRRRHRRRRRVSAATRSQKL